jgi:hypothetical protein
MQLPMPSKLANETFAAAYWCRAALILMAPWIYIDKCVGGEAYPFFIVNEIIFWVHNTYTINRFNDIIKLLFQNKLFPFYYQEQDGFSPLIDSSKPLLTRNWNTTPRSNTSMDVMAVE